MTATIRSLDLCLPEDKKPTKVLSHPTKIGELVDDYVSRFNKAGPQIGLRSLKLVDLASGGVLVTAIGAAVVGVLIFAPRLLF